ncbi:hypothetical protein PAXRUDRAFT_22661 [Paxillus rubicundulus Ve08.2h10]|uniref:Uncharacterized protein n=1 Tax=Paxillus rubicundulus Ve08.2h10 TaxID=930991 RepID=A0A0D0BJS4_9AGAM|nr:hypothetical protein PAXRUDRAFT_22661 [Paxillus rubicundulus Ve08.2h10]
MCCEYPLQDDVKEATNYLEAMNSCALVAPTTLSARTLGVMFSYLPTVHQPQLSPAPRLRHLLQNDRVHHPPVLYSYQDTEVLTAYIDTTSTWTGDLGGLVQHPLWVLTRDSTAGTYKLAKQSK